MQPGVPAGEIRVRQAVLVFADEARLECQRRHWPPAFRALFAPLRATSPLGEEADVHLFGEGVLNRSESVCQHQQRGRSFGERLHNAVAELSASGYERIVIIGSDCPNLGVEDIRAAFAALDEKRLVLGPDHRGGCYLIALRAEDRHLLTAVRWRRNTDFAELWQRGGRDVVRLAVKQDLDTLEDLLLLARSASLLAELAGELWQRLHRTGSRTRPVALSPCDGALRLLWQRPPPSPLYS